jgi:hypothetical protein
MKISFALVIATTMFFSWQYHLSNPAVVSRIR